MTAFGWIYIVLSEDSRSGVDAIPYHVEADAIEAAREIARDNASEEEDIHEEELTIEMIADGWILNITYSIEGDSVWVIKQRLR
jgi:hypothetical protein